jgi:hypothetical protein
MTALKWIAVAGAAGFVAIQFIEPRPANPPVDPAYTLETVESVPADVSRILNRSCGDCHSNTTSWPWYSHVAPVSWFTVGHVNDGRDELNFSEWGRYSERRRETRLRAMCSMSRDRSMPLPSYITMHRDAVLSDAEIATICTWTETRLSAEGRSRH